MDADLSSLRNADGSCQLNYGQRMRILCSVTGPGDVSSSKRKFDQANIFCNINRLPQKNRDAIHTVRALTISQQSQSSASLLKSHQSDRFISSIVESAIDVTAYPRTCIQICTQELHVDGPNESAQLNGICLALLDSGIRMYYVFAAVTLALVEEDGSRGNAEFIPNPDGIQASAAKAIFTFAFRPSTFMGGKLIGAYSTGEFTMEQHQNAVALAERLCLPIFDFYRQQIQQKFIFQISIATSTGNSHSALANNI